MAKKAEKVDIGGELAKLAAKIWHKDGQGAVTYSAVCKMSGKARGNVQYFFGSSEEMLRAAALSVIGSHRGGAPLMVDVVSGGLSRKDLTYVEALAWVARHGG